METWGKVTTTRSQVSVYRTNDPIDGNYCSHRPETLPRCPSYPFRVKKREKNSHCPVTVLVDSQVSNCCPWATCFKTIVILSELSVFLILKENSSFSYKI